MARLCERPGCSVPADVSYGFDAEHLVVWLDGFHRAQGASSGVLCRRHADAMVVPLGWMLDDRREPMPRLFRSPDQDPTGPMIRPRTKRARPDPVTGSVQLQLDAFDRSRDLAAAVEQAVTEAIAIGQHIDLAAGPDPDPDVEVPDEVPVEVTVEVEVEIAVGAGAETLLGTSGTDEDATDVLPWQPVFDELDDLHGLLKARGRLLSRAFHGVGADDR